MAYTLLQATNRVLKRVHLIQGESGEITDIDNAPSWQTDVNLIIDGWNEVSRHMYDMGAFQQQTAEGTITLVDATREYSLASNFQAMDSKIIIDRTNGQWMVEYPVNEPGQEPFLAMHENQFQPASYQGRPSFWCINPTNGKLRLDVTPTSAEAGDVYTYVYQKSLLLENNTDTFPYNDESVLELVPAVVQYYKLQRDKDYNPGIFDLALARAVEKTTGLKSRREW